MPDQPIEPPERIKRDRYDRPLITPPSGGKPVGYTRTSTFAKALSDVSGLTRWQLRMAMKGTVLNWRAFDQRMDGATNDLAIGDPEDNRYLDMLIAKGHDAAGGNLAAFKGTAIHALTEWVDEGEEFEEDAEGYADYMPFVREYQTLTTGLEMLDVETFCVQDDVQVAGTFDRLVRLHDGRVVIGDLKTGKTTNESPWETTVQIATYANSKRYDPETGERSEIHPDLDRTKGLLIHVPSNGAQAGLYLLDIEQGWEAAMLAVKVREWRKAKVIQPYFADAPPY
jgi:hypothetical protein